MNPEEIEKREQDRITTLFVQCMRFLRPALLIVVVVALIYLVYHVGPAKLIDTAASLSPGWVAVAVLLWGGCVMFAALRFQSLAAPELKYFEVLEVVMASHLLNFLSMVQGGGVGAKIGLMKGRRVPASRSLAGAGGELILDLLLNGLVTAVFAVYVGWSRSGMDRVGTTVWIILGITTVSGIAIALLLAKFTGFGARILDALRLAFSIERLPVNIISTVGILVMGSASFYCMLRAAGAGIPPLLPLAAMGVGYVVGLISLVPGGLGVRDVTRAYVCTSITSVPIALTATAAFAFRIMGITSVAIALGIWMLLKKREN